jgi:hypothetical protein
MVCRVNAIGERRFTMSNPAAHKMIWNLLEFSLALRIANTTLVRKK